MNRSLKAALATLTVLCGLGGFFFIWFVADQNKCLLLVIGGIVSMIVLFLGLRLAYINKPLKQYRNNAQRGGYRPTANKPFDPETAIPPSSRTSIRPPPTQQDRDADIDWLVEKLDRCAQICIEAGQPPHPRAEGGVAAWASDRLREIRAGRDPRRGD